MISIYIISFFFVFLYAWGGNTNGTWSPKIMTIGGLGFLLTVVVSSWISFKGSSWLWINIIWTSTIIWLILSGIFQRIFKYSWVDTLSPTPRQIRKKIKEMANGE